MLLRGKPASLTKSPVSSYSIFWEIFTNLSALHSADAFSADIFNTKFKPLLTTKKQHKLSDIINAELRAEGRRYRRAILEPGSSNGSEVELIRGYLGRDPDPNAYIEILAAATRA